MKCEACNCDRARSHRTPQGLRRACDDCWADVRDDMKPRRKQPWILCDYRTEPPE